jgi:hypothetical protein
MMGKKKYMKYFLPALFCAICGAWEIFLVSQGLRNQVDIDTPPMDTWQMVLFAIVLIALSLYWSLWGMKEKKKNDESQN